MVRRTRTARTNRHFPASPRERGAGSGIKDLAAAIEGTLQQAVNVLQDKE